MKETELKPCPFCGHKDITVNCFGSYDGYQGNCTRWFARCRFCGGAIERKSKEETIHAWNGRVDDKENMQLILERGEISKIIVDNFDNNGERYDASDFEWAAYQLQNAGYRKQVKVIKCKDCAYRDTEGCPLTYWDGGELVNNVKDDDFCSGAKMKGGAE